MTSKRGIFVQVPGSPPHSANLLEILGPTIFTEVHAVEHRRLMGPTCENIPLARNLSHFLVQAVTLRVEEIYDVAGKRCHLSTGASQDLM